jgi:hypothetical protein
MNLIKMYYIMRFSCLNNLIRLYNIDYPNYLNIDNLKEYDDYDIEKYTDFKITKKPDGKIICISQQSEIFDISTFHPCQLSMMRINIISFCNMTWPDSKSYITCDYLDMLSSNIEKILKEIISQIQPSNTQIKHKYELKNNMLYDLNTTNQDNKTYCVNIIKKILFDTEKASGKFNKTKYVRKMFEFLYSNIDFLMAQEKFTKTMIAKIVELEKEKYNLFSSILDSIPLSSQYIEQLSCTTNYVSSIERATIKFIKCLPYDFIADLLYIIPFNVDNILILQNTNSEQTNSEQTNSEQTNSEQTNSEQYDLSTNGSLNDLSTNGSVNVLSANGSLNESSATKSLNDLSTNGSLNDLSTTKSLNVLSTNGSLNDLSTTKSLNDSSATKSVNESSATKSLNESSATKSLNESSATKSLNDLSTTKSLNDSSTNGSLNESSATKSLNDLSTTKSLNDSSTNGSLNDSSVTESVDKSGHIYINDININGVTKSVFKLSNQIIAINKKTEDLYTQPSSDKLLQTQQLSDQLLQTQPSSVEQTQPSSVEQTQPSSVEQTQPSSVEQTQPLSDQLLQTQPYIIDFINEINNLNVSDETSFYKSCLKLAITKLNSSQSSNLSKYI